MIVVGAGVAGLAVAFELAERAAAFPGAVDIDVLEASDRPGGNVRTDRLDGWVCEWGPNGFLDNVAATPALVKRLDLEDRVIVADEQAAIRYIVRAGKMRRVATSPPAFLGSDVLTWPGKLRIGWEPFARRRPAGDESVFDFAARRIGREAARVLVSAMVTGIYAGDARQLSLEATFPKMHEMESAHGGLVKAMLAKRKEAKARGETAGGPAGPGGTLTSFRSGLQELTDRLAERVGPDLRLSTSIASINDMGTRGFRILLDSGAPIEADAIVLASPAWHAAKLVRDMNREMSAALDGIPSAPVAVVHVGFHKNRFPDGPPVGFGFLAPRDEGVTVLGTLFTSNIFPGHRAPDGRVLMTCMIGGALAPELVDRDDDALVRIARTDLEKTVGVTEAPEFVRVFRHPRGIPQYTIGHLDRVRTVERRLTEHPGLFACGNSYRGISVNHCVERAPTVAEDVLRFLDLRPAG